MSTDLVALDRVNTLAREGAANTASAIERLTGEPARAALTDIRITRRESLDRRYETSDYVGVHADFSGHVDGTAVIAMESSDAKTVAKAVGAEEGLIDSGLESMGSMAASSFVDVIANAAGSSIELEPPELVDTDRARLIPESAKYDEWIVTITSEFELPERVLGLEVVIVPEQYSVVTAMDPSDGGTAAVEKLVAIGELTRDGAESAAEHVSMMTGFDASVSVSRIRFAPIESIVEASDSGLAVGTVFELEETPEGYFALLFDEEAATRVADAMLPDGIGDKPTWAGMGQSAISELGNIVTSGFIDGWADAMGGTLAHSPPSFVADDRVALLSSLTSDLATDEVAGVIVDAEVILEGGAVGCTLHALPTRDGLELALDRIVT